MVYKLNGGIDKNDIGREWSGKLVVVGDSLVANGIGVASPDSTYFHQRGFFNWFQALTGYPFKHDAYYADETLPPLGHNVGVGSEETKDNLAQFQRNVIDKKPSVVFIIPSGNDLTAGRSAATILANVRKMTEMAQGIDATVWISTLFPRHDLLSSGFTAGQETIRQAANADIRDYANQTTGTVLVDCDIQLRTSTNTLIQSYSYDGVHLNSTGAYTVAVNAIYPIWRGLAGTDRIKLYKPEDYNASTIPFGNHVVSSEFTGTGGTTSTGVTGTLPDNWRAEQTGGSNIASVASIVSQADWNGDTRNFINHAITSDGSGVDGEILRTRTSSDISSLASGWYETTVECIIPSGMTENFLRSVYLQVRDLQGDDSYFRCFSTSYTGAEDPNAICASQSDTGAHSLTLDGDLVVSGAATIVPPARIVIDSGGADTATLTITGTDRDDAAQTNDIVLNGTTQVTGTKYFKTVTAVASDATISNGAFVGIEDVKDIFPQPGADVRLMLRTPPVFVDGGSDVSYYLMAEADCSIVGAVTVQWGQPVLKPLVVPANIDDFEPMVSDTGLTTLGSVTQPASGSVTVRELRTGAVVRTSLHLNLARMTVSDDGANGSYGTLNIYDFPAGAIVPLGSRQNYTAFVEGAALTGGAGDAVFEIGLGSTAIASEADGVLGATENDIGTDVNITLSGGTGAGTILTASSGAFDGTGTALNLNLNWSGTAATIDASSTIDVTGTITVLWSNMDDD
jgi:hypothetical protein